jgi:N-acetylmuramoyl-L-alanine amidase
MSKKLQLLVIHCTATPEGRPITAATIRRWHTAPKPQGNGWKQVGYSEMIHLDGTIETLVKYNDNDVVDSWEITNGATGINSIARHIVYVGGTDANGKAKDTRTPAQLKALEMYVKAHTTLQPQWKIAGHYHFAAKACPSFNVEKWLESIGIPEKNIYRKK